jgi:hypothetical protein
MPSASAARRVVFLTGLLVLAGCGHQPESKGPPTVPASGKVVFVRGGEIKALFDRQGRVEFESVEQPTMHAVGWPPSLPKEAASARFPERIASASISTSVRRAWSPRNSWTSPNRASP